MTTTHKSIVAVCLVLMAALFVSAPPSIGRSLENAWTLEAMNRQIDETNFLIEDYCSGTLIDKEKRLIVTAWHCVRGNIEKRHVKVELPNGSFIERPLEIWSPLMVNQNRYNTKSEHIALRKFRARILGYDAFHDVAIVQIEDDKAVFPMEAPLSYGDVQRGEDAWAVGNPLGIEAVVSKGVVGSTTLRLPRTVKETIRVIVFQFIINPGSSGGALYNAHGQIIGITNWGQVGGPYLASPVENVIALLDRLYPKPVAKVASA